jgi:predicted dehydrogenase
MLKWGIIGCGGVARNVIAPGIRLSNNGVLYAVGSRTDENACKFAADLEAERAYGSYEALLDDPDVQAVYIALPNALHMEWTIKAAAKGKHVLCDKQLALNAEEAVKMVDACREHGVQLMEAVFYRFHPQAQAIKKLIDEGRIGKLTRVSAMHSNTMPAPTNIRLNPELGGGVMGDTGCYCVNLARFLFDAEPTHASAIVEIGDSGVNERVVATLEFPEGRVAQFECSYRLEPGVYIQSYEVFGQRGHVYVPMGYAQVETYREGTIIASKYYIGNDAAIQPQSECVPCEPVHQWQLGLEYFAEKILTNEPIGPPAENGLASVRAIDAIFQSAHDKRAVEVAS